MISVQRVCLRLSITTIALALLGIIAVGCDGSSGSPAPAPNPFLLADVEAGIGGFAINGSAADRFMAEQIDGSGDINGDGFDDILISSASDAGRAFVVFGKPDTAAVATSDISAGTGGFAIISNASGGNLFDVASAGDVNGDGLDDIIVGTGLADLFGFNAAGAAYVIFGKTTTTTVDVADVAAGVGGFQIFGNADFENIGFDVGGGGDINGDGLDDVLVGAFSVSPLTRACYVVFGKTTTTAIDASDLASGAGGFMIFRGGGVHTQIGRAVSGAGDVNADGLDDIIVGDPSYDMQGGSSDRGAAFVVFGKSSGSPVDVDDVVMGTGGFAILSPIGNVSFGLWASAAGDVNGDGFEDVFAGSIGLTPSAFSGTTYLVFGKPTTESLLTSDIAQGRFGVLIPGAAPGAALGDLDGDGLDDFIVGASTHDLSGATDSGATYVIYGVPSARVIGLQNVAAGIGGYAFAGIELNSFSGAAVSSGDINGDGIPDLITATSQFEAGKVFVAFLPPV